jgi:hypothetical protein
MRAMPRTRTQPPGTITGSWLASRLGVEPRGIEAQRRAGELLAFRLDGSQEYLYPSWQFGRDFDPLPGLARVVQAARATGLDDRGLNDLLLGRSGLVRGKRLVDVLREGNVDHVVSAIRSRG